MPTPNYVWQLSGHLGRVNRYLVERETPAFVFVRHYGRVLQAKKTNGPQGQWFRSEAEALAARTKRLERLIVSLRRDLAEAEAALADTDPVKVVPDGPVVPSGTPVRLD